MYDPNQYISVLTEDSKHGTIVNKALCLELFAKNQKNYLPRFFEKEKEKLALKEDILAIDSKKRKRTEDKKEKNDDDEDGKMQKEMEREIEEENEKGEVDPKKKKRKIDEDSGNLFEKMLQNYMNAPKNKNDEKIKVKKEKKEEKVEVKIEKVDDKKQANATRIKYEDKSFVQSFFETIKRQIDDCEEQKKLPAYSALMKNSLFLKPFSFDDYTSFENWGNKVESNEIFLKKCLFGESDQEEK